ncbi:phosphoribosyltransferase-like protein [Streptomyces griseoincarnatus]
MYDVPPRPSETRRGIEWLKNFAPGDDEAAQLLLNSLWFISETTFRQELSARLQTVLTDGHVKTPAALFSVQSYGPPGGTMFHEPVTPLVSSSNSMGSELVVQNIIGATHLSLPNSVVSRGATDLAKLRQRRVRSLVFVSDQAGSGRECLEYTRTWLRNKTIRSWRSLRLIKLYLVVFAASTSGLRRLRNSGLYDGIWMVRHGMDFASAQWTEAQRRKVRSLCERYERRVGEGLGWEGSGGLAVFEHTVPNNLPSILRQTKGPSRRPDGWAPLFSNRSAPPDLMRELSGYAPKHDPVQGLRALGQQRLARADEMRPRYRSGVRNLAEVLGHVAGGRRHAEQLARAVSVSVPTAEEIIVQVRAWGLIDAQSRLTDAGWAELRAAKAKPRHVLQQLQGSQEPYYPHSLRESRWP